MADGTAPREPNVDRVLHEYDGIEEYDNDLPTWWLASLFATIVFAFGYWYWVQVFAIAETPRQTLRREMQAVYAAEAARMRARGAITPEMLLAMSRDDATVRQGRATFASTCAACHGATGGGGIGPNLTDTAWLHGASPDRVYRTITDGVTARGMPAWGPQLGADRVLAVTAYLVTLRNTNVPGGKAPQGTAEP